MIKPLDEILKEYIKRWAYSTLFTIFSTAHANRFRIGKSFDEDDVLPGTLTVRSGRLLRSLSSGEFIKSFATGENSEAIRNIKFDGGKLLVDWGTRVIYANIHEFGGTIITTDKARRFFWRKFYETGKTKWMRLALSKVINIPPRPYFYVALQAPETKERIDKTLTQAIENSLKEFLKTIK